MSVGGDTLRLTLNGEPAELRAQAGKPSARMASTSRMAPSMTTAAMPFCRHDSVASSPQIAGGRPPASITSTSPGWQASMASTGLAQSPG